MNAKYLSLTILALMLIVFIISFQKSGILTKKKSSSKKIYTEFKPIAENQKNIMVGGKTRKKEKRYMYKSAARAMEIKEHIYGNAGNITMNAYNSYVGQFKVSKEHQNQTKTLTSQYEEMERHYQISLPEYQLGLQLYASKDYEEAIRQFSISLEKIDKMDLLHSIDCYKMLAECYFKQKNKDGYIQNKIRQIRMERKKSKIISDAFPQETFSSFSEWPTTAESSKNLLQTRSAFNRGENGITAEQVRRAEYDLEVSRQVTR